MLYSFNKDILYLKLNSSSIQFFDFYHRLLKNGNRNHLHGEGIYEFHYVVDGTAKLLIDFNKEYTIQKDDFFIVGPFVNHCQLADKNNFTEKITFCIKVNDLVLNNELHNFKNLKFKLRRNASNVKPLFLKLEEALCSGVDMDSKVWNILAEAWKFTKILSDGKYNKSQIIEMINEDFSIGPKDAALKLGVSVRTLERICQNCFDMTFVSLRNERRLQHATSLLEFTDLPIPSVCVESGFNSIDNFNMLFKRKYGVTPRKYRVDFDKTKNA